MERQMQTHDHARSQGRAQKFVTPRFRNRFSRLRESKKSPQQFQTIVNDHATLGGVTADDRALIR